MRHARHQHGLFPTILDMAGVPDGAGPGPMASAWCRSQSGSLTREELFWHYPHYQHYQLGGATPYGAVHAGDFKLIEFFEDMHVELYNLRDDIGEQHNLAAQMPDKVNELRDTPARLAKGGRRSDADAEPEIRSVEAGVQPPPKKNNRPSTVKK